MSQENDTNVGTGSQTYQSSSANTLCSMETLDVSDTAVYSEEDDGGQAKESAWGRLLPIGSDFSSKDLCNQTYVFGRGDDCDVSFNDPQSANPSKYLVYSKIHFVLTREKTSKGCHTYLEDVSSNGTFINGTKVGKKNKQVLNNNDEIALATKRNKAFVFLDLNVNDDDDVFPEEVRSRYTISRVIGRGACGEVRLAFEKGTCRKFALKIISKNTFSMGGRTLINLPSSHVMNEVRVLRALKHPCIVDIEDVIDTSATLFIVLELVEGGDLFERVKGAERLDESAVKLLFYQLVVAIKHLHEKGVTHRDLKLENVLLSTDDADTLIKVTDFGLSKFMDANSLMKTFCGTPNYLAPEVLKTAGSGSYTEAVDCWSLGVILFMCLSGYPPFSDEYGDLPLAHQIIKGRYTFPKDDWSNVSEEAIDLIKRFLTVDPRKRLTTNEALNHPWLTDDEMVTKARKLMFPESANGIVRTRTKPTLKRQREESDETLDGDSDDGSAGTAVTTPKKKTATGDSSP